MNTTLLKNVGQSSAVTPGGQLTSFSNMSVFKSNHTKLFQEKINQVRKRIYTPEGTVLYMLFCSSGYVFVLLFCLAMFVFSLLGDLQWAISGSEM